MCVCVGDGGDGVAIQRSRAKSYRSEKRSVDTRPPFPITFPTSVGFPRQVGSTGNGVVVGWPLSGRGSAMVVQVLNVLMYPCTTMGPRQNINNLATQLYKNKVFVRQNGNRLIIINYNGNNVINHRNIIQITEHNNTI